MRRPRKTGAGDCLTLRPVPRFLTWTMGELNEEHTLFPTQQAANDHLGRIEPSANVAYRLSRSGMGDALVLSIQTTLSCYENPQTWWRDLIARRRVLTPSLRSKLANNINEYRHRGPQNGRENVRAR